MNIAGDCQYRQGWPLWGLVGYRHCVAFMAFALRYFIFFRRRGILVWGGGAGCLRWYCVGWDTFASALTRRPFVSPRPPTAFLADVAPSVQAIILVWTGVDRAWNGI